LLEPVLEPELPSSEPPELDPAVLDPAVVAELYVQHADGLRWFLQGLLKDADLAGDVLQMTFTKVLERGHTARQESLKSWIYQVAYNEAMAWRRRQAVGKRVVQKAAWTRPQEDPSPESHVVRWELVAEMRTAIGLLPDEQQRIVRMRIYEQKTFATISEELNIPLGTALGRMRSALAKLRSRFENTSHAEQED